MACLSKFTRLSKCGANLSKLGATFVWARIRYVSETGTKLRVIFSNHLVFLGETLVPKNAKDVIDIGGTGNATPF